ncbi:hypothetical protein VTK73DRAFT_9017 [Phialemonium thermophilum]|uniref:Uncharacterized protein n=1 Tax=Phialemonium thermophilum TaxID=223376 RepID=A0ABR3W5A6_9PEZI
MKEVEVSTTTAMRHVGVVASTPDNPAARTPVGRLRRGGRPALDFRLFVVFFVDVRHSLEPGPRTDDGSSKAQEMAGRGVSREERMTIRPERLPIARRVMLGSQASEAVEQDDRSLLVCVKGDSSSPILVKVFIPSKARKYGLQYTLFNPSCPPPGPAAPRSRCRSRRW